MSVKQVNIPQVGLVSLYKRRGAKTMRLSISHEGEVRLTMPKWTPYNAGVLFINGHLKWISEHQSQKLAAFANHMRIGKAHTLYFIDDTSIDTLSSRISRNEIKIYIPTGYDHSSAEVQGTVKKACLRALRKESEQLLPLRLADLANQYGFSYTDVKIKQLKSRWGSCNNFKQITLNLYLIQLPWELIDYVILHELTHTKVLAHGSDFWNELSKYLPNAKSLKKQINSYKPVINSNL
jgi:predicted metal-dependent hydrolase